jgi:hypothetical protein
MGGDIKGGGLTFYESNVNQNPSLQYGEGLRVPRVKASLDLDGLTSTAVYGKRKGFERVSK